jgi:hypothetical protein
VASLAAISLYLRIRADARDGLDQFHRLAAAKALDDMPGFVFRLFSGSHGAKVRLKSICFQYGCVSHHQKGAITHSSVLAPFDPYQARVVPFELKWSLLNRIEFTTSNLYHYRRQPLVDWRVLSLSPPIPEMVNAKKVTQ